MHRRHLLRILMLTATACSVAIACSAPTPLGSAPVPTAAPVELTVSAAASVQDALQAVQAAYQVENPEVTITDNFGSSGSLAQQVIQGAPTDVFLSASEQWMDELEFQGQIRPESRRDLLQNTLVLVVPQGQTAIADFAALNTPVVTKVAMGEPDSVPAGQYGQEVLTALNLFDSLQPKLVFGKNVRQVLAYVETGNVDAGLVYATDAHVSDRVEIVATAAATTHAPIRYPVAVVADSDRPAAAQSFVDFLSSDTAIAIFQEYGFGMVE